jgi:hypothetical protein
LEYAVIPSILKAPVSLARELTVGVVRVGVGGATTILRRVLPHSDGSDEVTPPPAAEAPSPRVSTEPVTQPPTPKKAPTPGATTTMADPAPATMAARKKAPAKKAPAKKATAKKAPAKKRPASTPRPTKPAATLDEPTAPVAEDRVVYSSGPEVSESLPVENLEEIRPQI